MSISQNWSSCFVWLKCLHYPNYSFDIYKLTTLTQAKATMMKAKVTIAPMLVKKSWMKIFYIKRSMNNNQSKMVQNNHRTIKKRAQQRPNSNNNNNNLSNNQDDQTWVCACSQGYNLHLRANHMHNYQIHQTYHKSLNTLIRRQE